jgi:ribonuclease D
LCERLAKATSSASIPNSCARTPIGPSCAWSRSPIPKEAAAIDPLAPGIDLSPLLDLLTDNEDVLKVFHAGGQDVEIIYNLTGRTPHPIFDTQIAMMAVSQSEQIGYSNLVESWLGITVDKGARFTDWSRRPLTERQIEYAIGDVTHLAKIFPKLLNRLIKTGRGAWLDIEMEKLADPANYRNDPSTAWQRIKAAGRNPACSAASRRWPPGARPKRRTRTSRAAASCATKRWPTSPAIRPRPRPTLPRCAACRRAGRTTRSASG